MQNVQLLRVKFKEIGEKYGTEKVYNRYHEMYGEYFGLRRTEKLNILKIGLACSNSYGPDSSLKIWGEFLPDAQISILEYNKSCADKVRPQVEHMFVGNQSSLKTVGKTAGPFDAIIGILNYCILLVNFRKFIHLVSNQNAIYFRWWW